MLRSPSLGATQALLDECRRHNEVITPVQQRELYNSLKSKMLRVLISCSGAKTINELLDILELELKSGILLLLFPIGTNFPQSNGVPEKWTTINVAIGIASFARCARCKLAHYCCKECQVKDWKDRHRQVCQEGADFRDKVKGGASFLKCSLVYTVHRSILQVIVTEKSAGCMKI